MLDLHMNSIELLNMEMNRFMIIISNIVNWGGKQYKVVDFKRTKISELYFYEKINQQ